MKRFSTLSKSAFWSQFLLGLVAIFALPSVSTAAETPATSVVERQISTLSAFSVQSAENHAQAAIFFPQTLFSSSKQAVEFCEFFAKPYRLFAVTNPPIRAGPQSNA